MEEMLTVETSDAEEREEIRALSPRYWSNIVATATTRPRGAFAVGKHSLVSGSIDQHNATFSWESAHISPKTNAEGPPRKRVKVWHEAPTHRTSASLPTTPTRDRSRPTSPILRSAPCSPRTWSPCPEIMFQKRNLSVALSTPRRITDVEMPDYDDSLCIDADDIRPEEAYRQPSSSLPVVDPPAVSSERVEAASRASSADPISLLTPRRALPIIARSLTRYSQHEMQGLWSNSPLTPIHSPIVLTLGADHATSPTPAGTSRLAMPNFLSGSEAPRAEFEHDDANDARHQDHEDAHRRYSFRARQAWQKNPYAYDKAMYKRQMRSNPEAIVKVVSPARGRKHRRSSSRGNAGSANGSDAEEEYVDQGGQEDDESYWQRRRADPREGSRSRSAGASETVRKGQGTQHHKFRSADTAVHPEISSAASRSHSTASSNHLQREGQEKWLPAALNETFSSSSEDDFDERIEMPPKQPKDPAEDALKPANPKPFPMRKRNVVRRSPQPARGLTGSPVKEHSAVDSTINDAPEDDESQFMPRWRRRKSATAISPQSSPPSIASSVAQDHPDAAPDDDVLMNFGSPPAIGFSSPSFTSIDADASPFGTRFSSNDDLSHPLALSDTEITSEGNPEPPQTSDHVSDEDSGFESSSSVEALTARDRRRLKVLQRMMPRVLVQRHLQNTSAHRSRNSADRGHNLTNGEETLRPGQSRVRVRAPGDRTVIEIRGDSESSDMDKVEENTDAAESTTSESEVDVDHFSRSRRKVPIIPSHSHADVDESGSDSSIDDAKIERWVSESHPPLRKDGRNDAVREGDLIDRMLSRTRVSGGKGRRQRGSTQHGTSKRRKSGGSMHVITSGARRTGVGHQTKLQFPLVDVPRSKPDARHHEDTISDAGPTAHPPSVLAADVEDTHIDEMDADASSKKRQRKKYRQPGGLFTFASEGGRLISGRMHDKPISMETEESSTNVLADFSVHEHLREKWASPSSKPHRLKNHLAGQTFGQTLNEYWLPDEDDRLDAPQVVNVEMTVSRRVTVDFGIRPLPPGIAFGSDTYLGLGCLHEVISVFSADYVPARPNLSSFFDIHLNPIMSPRDVEVCLEKVLDLARDWITGRDNIAVQDSQRWQMLLHSLALHVSWVYDNAVDEERAGLDSAVEKHISHLDTLITTPVVIISDEETPNRLTFDLRWFTIELLTHLNSIRKTRFGQVHDQTHLVHARHLICELWKAGFQDLLKPFAGEEREATQSSLATRIAELWICMIHLLGAWASILPTSADLAAHDITFWGIFLQTLKSEHLLQKLPSDLAISEMVWRSIFCLTSLSQFSMHGISTSSPKLGSSWPLVIAALEEINLAANPVIDGRLPKRSLRKRDEYIRILVSRCLTLTQLWRWQLTNASLLFNRLLDIFKSRHFANLLDEPSDYPSFLRHSNLELLSENKRSDTAFTLFLKIVVQAAKDVAGFRPGQDNHLPPHVKKLLSLCVPVGSVPFTKTSPPSNHELSMLYNRFSAVAVAIYLEPTISNLKYRLSNARRYVNFEDADRETRRACIRGLMHLAILLRHLRLPLQDALEWLADMTNILVDEYQAPEVAEYIKNWAVVSVQMLLGCVRRIIQTPLMENTQTPAPYPEPELLGGPWVTRVFSTSTKLSAVPTTSMEIRKLVEAFLNARAAVMSRPSNASPMRTAEESQESQDEFASLDNSMCFDDPDLIAALSTPEELALLQDRKKKDERVCEIIDKHIMPAVYRFVCKHVNVTHGSGVFPHQTAETDRWIDCWVGCANIIIQNDDRKNWDFYLLMGPQSWEKIIDVAWRRHVGLRFMWKVLQLDPIAYFSEQDGFLSVFFQAMVAGKISIEHEYISELFSIDKLRHPLLRGIPCEPKPGVNGYSITRAELLDNRLTFLDRIFANLTEQLRKESEGDISLRLQNQTSITGVCTMFSTMRDILQELHAGSEDHRGYASFCRQVYSRFLNFPALSSHPRLLSTASWAKDLP
ncbi:uncharacterized protein LAESUDRAFT_675011 [Laetiporus sulphureus 93-53]|uniref:Mus7/MMS22 family-domain-containing protein n=1 Tax=Laetiporus sulphureus 93-53 TaxID=1314785 RepID=A0A165FMQ3_9APHY|nr:uncharacterized protein LAESUDRAFT_675011 [Laetiporus sulphureus 93-53]KZT09203.1 hypothetical protein LAESUDRAFT_675011 [Laetiporus sulphureus 93-53]